MDKTDKRGGERIILGGVPKTALGGGGGMLSPPESSTPLLLSDNDWSSRPSMPGILNVGKGGL